jgi:hypothetical protein
VDIPKEPTSERQRKLQDNEHFKEMAASECCKQLCLQHWAFIDIKQFTARFAELSNKKLSSILVDEHI